LQAGKPEYAAYTNSIIISSFGPHSSCA
jgi:hypothetical protein